MKKNEPVPPNHHEGEDAGFQGGLTMGHFTDEHLIIQSADEYPLQKLRDEIIDWVGRMLDEQDLLLDYSDYVGRVQQAIANGGFFLYLPPDGSKEGWETSNAMDKIRNKIYRRVMHMNAHEDTRIHVIKITDDENEIMQAGWVV